MNKEKSIDKYLPLSEATYYIMTALVEPRHGYAVMQYVDHISDGQIKIGPGTLYGAFQTLEKDGLIEMVEETERRKAYGLTQRGKLVLQAQIERLQSMAKIGGETLRQLQ